VYETPSYKKAVKAGFKKEDLGQKEAELPFGPQNRFAAVLYRQKEVE